MILCINTQDKNKVIVQLKINNQIVDSLLDTNEYGSQVLIPLIQKLLDKNKVILKDLKGIEIKRGPGSFTGLRVGAAVANALGFALGIPVNGKKSETDLKY